MTSNRPPLWKPSWERPVWRIVAFVAFVVVAVIVLVARLIEVQLFDGAKYRAAAWQIKSG